MSRPVLRGVGARKGSCLPDNVRRYGRKLLITPAWKNVQALLNKVRDIVKEGRAKTQEWVIEKLNPILRGWSNFHRHVWSKATYQWVDHIIFRLLLRWAKRRHPNKSVQWVKDRYFHRIGDREWVFSTDGTSKCCLYTTASPPIRRYVKIKGQANPFHPEWDQYFATRKLAAKTRKELDTLFGGTLGKQSVCGKQPALEGSRAS